MQCSYCVVLLALLAVCPSSCQEDTRSKRGTITLDFGLLLRNLLQKSADLSSVKANITRNIVNAKTTRRPAMMRTTTTAAPPAPPTPPPPPPPPPPPRRRPHPFFPGPGWPNPNPFAYLEQPNNFKPNPNAFLVNYPDDDTLSQRHSFNLKPFGSLNLDLNQQSINSYTSPGLPHSSYYLK
ncbi:PREDICTED: serine/arginine repetitive matrix protein 1 [Drosophila arizonae]|uniref:Serine/arginine repetitive matrix protein 1 n=1 Tax=Drosophila arizonae TaxID=7263 RepID=A0ABM1PQF9_DROAR|nr:PREDICTED: serine/arginine repetitive matrix protein 1 [Drosophila arizonae]